MSRALPRSNTLLAWAGDLGSCAAWLAAVSWVDALRLGLPASPRAGLAEMAELAAKDGLRLLPPVLATAVIALVAARIRRSRSGEAVSAAPSARSIAGPVLLAWAAALTLLAASGFSIRVGWIAAAILTGTAAGILTARLRASRPARPRGAGALLAAGLLWAATGLLSPLLAAGAAGGPPASPRAGGAPSFILVVIDALRADRLGIYGHDRDTSPSLDRMARSGILFTGAVAPSSWTPPSMASLLTSSTVGQHGLVEKGQGLPEGADLLASRLAKAGYRTAAFTTNPWLKGAFGFDGGFATYLDIDRMGLERRLVGVRLKNWALERMRKIRVEPELVPEASEVTRRALDWLARNGDAPFFLYLHYMDVHSPYDAVEPYHGAFCSGHAFDVPDHLLEVQFRKGRHRDDAEVLEHVLELYDEEILATDAAIGRLVDGVARLGLDEATHVFVTSDHGEEFLDHGGVMHGQTLYEELIRVPLIVRPAKREALPPHVVGERVSTLDLYPTLLDIAGLPPRKEAAGASLVPLLRAGDVPEAPRLIASQLFRKGFASTALYLEGDKFIRRQRIARLEGASTGAAPGAEDVTLELYRLESDPRERINIAGIETAAAESFGRLASGYEALWGVPGAGEARSPETIDPETLEQLRALGYVD